MGIPPFNSRSFAGTVGPLPATAFSPNVAILTPPGLTLEQQIPTYYPLYLPDGSMNQFVGPSTPLANGLVIAGDAAVLTQACGRKTPPATAWSSRMALVVSIARRVLAILSRQHLERLPAGAPERHQASRQPASRRPDISLRQCILRQRRRIPTRCHLTTVRNG